MCFDCSLSAVGGDSVVKDLRIVYSFLFLVLTLGFCSTYIFIELLKLTLNSENPDHVLISPGLLMYSFSRCHIPPSYFFLGLGIVAKPTRG